MGNNGHRKTCSVPSEIQAWIYSFYPRTKEINNYLNSDFVAIKFNMQKYQIPDPIYKIKFSY